MSLSFLATNTLCYSSSIKPLRRRTITHQPPLPQVTAAAAAAANNNHLVASISCEHQQQPKQQIIKRKEGLPADHVIDRRNMLVGLGGGLYGATSVANKAIAEPFMPPDIVTCKPAKDPDDGNKDVPCCGPYSPTATIKDFRKPGRNEPKRVRKAAHKYTPEDVAKFERAIKLMKDLPADDPRNFWQQGTIHCTFCNGAFDQAGTNGVPLLIHGSWFFLPWHRMYIYFWERILGSLIGDPTFSIPYWNWDAADGMYMPEMYWKNKDSPLFDSTRNKNHYRTLMDFDYSFEKQCPHPCAPTDDIVMRNQCALNRDFTEAEYETSLFMGKPLRAGENPVEASGSCEGIHNMMHMWAGPTTKPYHNMGNFVTAGKDPLFYAHHGNVDRMWDTYTKSREGRPEFRDRDWLDSTFIFVDENKDIVRCRVRDFLRVEQLGYSYSEEEQPWKEMDYKKCKELLSDTKQSSTECETVQVSVFGSQPRQLKETTKVLIKRPTWSSKNPPEGVRREELLSIKDIEYTSKMPPKFDVYITPAIRGTSGAFDSVCKDIKGDQLRSFREIPHHKHRSGGRTTKSDHIVAITQAVEGVNMDMVVVTLVPSDGEVTIGGIEINGSEIQTI